MKKILPLSSSRGFTLLEIVIVIAVMSLMGLIVYPNYAKIHQNAKAQAAKSVAQSIHLALSSYNLQEGHFPPNPSLPITELANLLLENGHLSKFPSNPFTGRPYTDSDPSGEITYQYHSQTHAYTLTLKGPNNLPLLTLSN